MYAYEIEIEIKICITGPCYLSMPSGTAAAHASIIYERSKEVKSQTSVDMDVI